MPLPPDRPPSTSSRLLWWLVAMLGAIAAAVFLFAISQRLFYPHELEWMEGALVDHAARVANGQPLYCEPTPEHVPFLYAPMLFWLGGLVIRLGGDGLFALRFVATAASIGCAMLIGHWVRRETGRLVSGLAATGLFVAGYGWLAWWYDLARNDSLFVLAVLTCAYQLRHGGRRRWFVAGLAATFAVLTKQSALMWLPAIAIGACCLDWRTGLRFVATAAASTGVALGWMHLASDGWSTFWLFEMPRHHGVVAPKWLGFWTENLRPLLPLTALVVTGAIARWRAGGARDALFHAAFAGGGIVTSWASILHVGGFDNVMEYALAAVCVPGAIAAANGRLARVVGPALLLVQVAWLGLQAWHREPLRTLLPSPAHRRAHDELLAFVRAQPGPVWIPAHGNLGPHRAGDGGAHGQAIFDLLQCLPRTPDGQLDLAAFADEQKLAALSPRVRAALVGFRATTIAAIAAKRYAAIVVDEAGAHMFPQLFAAAFVGPDGVAGTADDPYERAPGQLLREPTALRPLVGFDVHSPYALLPRR